MAKGDIEKWSYYFPEDGETAEDAREIPASDIVFNDAYWAAKAACRLDYQSHDGWERMCLPFKIILMTPSGNEVPFICQHENTVEHSVREE